MNCRYTTTRISPYLDGELRGDEMLRVRSHLTGCRACMAEYESAVSLKRLVGSLPLESPTEEFQSRLLATIRTTPRREQGKAFWPDWRLATALAAAAVAALVVSQFGRSTVGGSTPSSTDVIALDQDWNMARASFPGNGIPAGLGFGGR
jgi:anti-sigma factor RsiW